MLRMMLTAALGLAFLGFGVAEDKKEVPKELLPLQGKWKMTTSIIGGIEKMKTEDIMVIEGNQITMERDGKLVNTTVKTIKIDSSKNPSTIDIDVPGRFTLLGLFKVEKDTLTLCLSDKRPTEFESPKDSKIAITTFEKVK